ncbi:MAG TPA: DUF4082 domain-containing protein [Chitinophagales bacterium]|nr:DUF4082 domain-containing protein [Chitinophagales bacterium]
MRNLINTLAIVFVIGMAISCKKDKTTNVNFENPVQAASKNTTLLDSTRNYPGFDFYEIGTKIYFSKAGKVTKLGCRSGNTGNFVVSFWDFESSALLAQTTVNVTDKTKYFYSAITPIEIVPNKRYIISLNNNNGGVPADYWICYKREANPDGIDFNIYPFNIGSVTFEAPYGKTSATAVFPSNPLSPWNFLAGADVQFEYE